jgi:aminoglycoside phosphotransferase
MSALLEAAVSAQDEVVPFRDLLLDGDVVGAHLARSAGADGPLAVAQCACVHAKYRAGHGLRTVYRLRADGREHWLAARAVREPGRAARHAALALAGAAPAGPLRAVFAVPELGAVFYAFPNDRKISDLRVLADEAALAALCGRPRVRAELVAWAAETTVTARCVEPDGRVAGFAKVYVDDLAARAISVNAALGEAARDAGGTLRLPRVLGASLSRRAFVLEPIAGVRLFALSGRARADAYERLGAALAVLHGLPAPAAAPHFDRLEGDRLRTAAAAIAHAHPAVATAANDIAEDLVARAPEPQGAGGCLHGDAHPGNVLVDGKRIGLIDLDLAARGPAAADPALALAGLRQERLVGRIDAHGERVLAARLLAGYAAVRPLPEPSDLAWHTAGWLLARPALPGAVSGHVRPSALAHLPGLVDEARALLAEGSPA